MFPFEILIDTEFINFNNNTDLKPIDKKRLLSIANQFEGGHWWYSKFQDFIWNNVAETALSQKEREKLAGEPASILREAAKKLRLTESDKDISKGSELAEIVLYGIMKQHYKALPIVPKIYYKQNPRDNAKGADSVHIIIVGDDDFTLWFGESKFYNSIEDARLDEIIKSVGNSLETEKLKKENSIITDLSDINLLITNEALRDKIKDYLNTNRSIDKLKPKLNIPILLLYECPITISSSLFDQNYIDKISAYHKDRAQSYFSKQLSKLSTVHLYSEISFHIILFPTPAKAKIIDTFVAKAELHKS